jgi:hypothetical protein
MEEKLFSSILAVLVDVSNREDLPESPNSNLVKNIHRNEVSHYIDKNADENTAWYSYLVLSNKLNDLPISIKNKLSSDKYSKGFSLIKSKIDEFVENKPVGYYISDEDKGWIEDFWSYSLLY